ncbi:hypothetical protein MIND_01264200 [Mycena indigotica]|uniref:Uncharacterized protein n=1 Tax=Mycena indigotica TaxID=2126181 RepID=A0A8H6S206_9AGAR|nr:uncharacterized protein MIND_01264200 [Mycena indigotica]KAF7291208.1 hypothetical protein MIND_01264200 [Mycena indigotica]
MVQDLETELGVVERWKADQLEYQQAERETGDIQQKRWARPAYREVMHQYFKILRAKEEIELLNIEIRRVLTWMRDDAAALQEKGVKLRDTSGKSPEKAEQDGLMAVQLAEYASRRHRFNDTHIRRFHSLAILEGFTGSLQLGQAIKSCRVEMNDMDIDEQAPTTISFDEVMEKRDEEYGSDDEGDEAQDTELSDLIFMLAGLGIDQNEGVE